MTLEPAPPQATGLAPGASWWRVGRGQASPIKPQGASPRDDAGGDAPFRPEAGKESAARMASVA
jgi:hypothetical protein